MSGILLRETVRDMLRQHLGFKGIREIQCRVMDDELATPEPHQVFIGISPGRWKQWGGWKLGPTLDEEFGLSVTVSAKNGAIQPQLYGELIVQKKIGITSCGIGIEALCREIITFLHDNPDVACTMNAAIGDTQVTGGLFFADGGRAERKQASWWMCPCKKEDSPIGMSQTVQFYGLRRTQASGSLAT